MNKQEFKEYIKDRLINIYNNLPKNMPDIHKKQYMDNYLKILFYEHHNSNKELTELIKNSNHILHTHYFYEYLNSLPSEDNNDDNINFDIQMLQDY